MENNKDKKVVLNDKLLDKVYGGRTAGDGETCSPDDPDDPGHEWVSGIGGIQTCFKCGAMREPNR